MIVSEISKRYAKALFLGSSGNYQTTFESLVSVESILFKDADIRSFFLSPMNSVETKAAVLKKAFEGKSVPVDVEGLLQVLIEKSRITAFPEVVEAFTQLMDEEAGITRGTVKSAKPLSAQATKDLEEKISGVLKKKIVLKYQEDSALLGGVVAHVGGWTFDDSIETHLKKLNEELNRRTN